MLDSGDDEHKATATEIYDDQRTLGIIYQTPIPLLHGKERFSLFFAYPYSVAELQQPQSKFSRPSTSVACSQRLDSPFRNKSSYSFCTSELVVAGSRLATSHPVMRKRKESERQLALTHCDDSDQSVKSFYCPSITGVGILSLGD